MKEIAAVVFTVVLSVGLGGAAYSGEESGAHWGYTGHAGPQRWGDLSADWALCKTGKAQSPIDIQEAAPRDLEPIEFDYAPTQVKFSNNGHTLQLGYAPGSGIRAGGEEYELLQLHFHSPSENTVRGQPYAMEMHLVHKSDEGELAVVGVFLRRGEHNEVLQKLWDVMPKHAGEDVPSDDEIDAGDLLPEHRSSYRFAGSLTTPPCSEGVRWFVMQTPVEVSDEQVALFRAVLGENARPTQPLNGRTLASKN